MLFFVQSNVVEKGNGAKKSDLARDLLSGRVDAISGSVCALIVDSRILEEGDAHDENRS